MDLQAMGLVCGMVSNIIMCITLAITMKYVFNMFHVIHEKLFLMDQVFLLEKQIEKKEKELEK